MLEESEVTVISKLKVSELLCLDEPLPSKLNAIRFVLDVLGLLDSKVSNDAVPLAKCYGALVACLTVLGHHYRTSGSLSP